MPRRPAMRWQWRAAIYGWFPGLDARSNVQIPSGSRVDVDIGPDRYLSSLEFAFMGTLEARKGPWSFVVDAIDINFGKSPLACHVGRHTRR
jgi:hypothetical protein